MTGSVPVAEAIARTCHDLWRAGLMPGASGNVSVRLGPDRLLVTPSGRLNSALEARDMVEVDDGGRVIRGFHDPTSELPLHLGIHRRSPGSGAVVHAHPPAATGFAVAGETLDPTVLPELALDVGAIPLVPYGEPGTVALAEQVEAYVEGHCGVLLANHGVVCWGSTLRRARIRLESLEQAAKIILAARSLGRVNRLTSEQYDQLAERRRMSRHGS